MASLPIHSFSLMLFFYGCCCCVSLRIINPASSALTDASPSDDTLLASVCRNTSDYNFCFDSLSSSPWASKDDRIDLAYISFRLAVFNATDTKAYIQALMNASSSSSSLLHPLKRCSGFYDDAIEALSYSLSDLDSETYDGLVHYSVVGCQKPRVCQACFTGNAPIPTPLSAMNDRLEKLSQICLVISRLFIVAR